MQQIESIESVHIRALALSLYAKGIAITYFGMPWTNCTNNWIYFDTFLDTDALRKQFELGSEIIIHENRDPKSGLERGFIDTITGEAIMGKADLP